jgi:hypothetical protein
MSETAIYRLGSVGCEYRNQVAQKILKADDGAIARIGPATRNLDQNARFHAMCGDVARQIKHVGRTLTLAQWKILFISGHSVATNEGADMVPGLEMEYVNLRESSASMGVKRMASLIEYVMAFGTAAGVRWSEPTAHYRREL